MYLKTLVGIDFLIAIVNALIGNWRMFIVALIGGILILFAEKGPLFWARWVSQNKLKKANRRDDLS